MRKNIPLILVTVAVLIVLIFAVGAIPSLKTRLEEKTRENEQLVHRLNDLREFEATIANLEADSSQLLSIWDIGDDFAEEIGVRELLGFVFDECALDGNISIRIKKQSAEFPEYVDIQEFQGELGFKEYKGYSQLLDFFNHIHVIPMKVEIVDFMSKETDMKVKGKIRMKFKVFLTPRSE
jgi:hypothetical protein